MKINDLYHLYLPKFKENNISENSLKILIQHFAKLDNLTDVILYGDTEILLTLKIKNAIKKVLKGIPVQYVISTASFYGYDFYVYKHVLIPRPETEELVFETLKLIDQHFIDDSRTLHVVDVCSGSGNIGISIDKTLFKKHTVIGYDISLPALLVSNKNKKDLQSNCKFYRSDLLSKAIKEHKKFNVIVSNPPYIGDKSTIDKNVYNYEPHLALLSNPPEKFYINILNQAKTLLEDKFIIAFEIGYDLKETLLKYLDSDEFYSKNTNYIFRKDMEHLDRFLFITSK